MNGQEAYDMMIKIMENDNQVQAYLRSSAVWRSITHNIIHSDEPVILPEDPIDMLSDIFFYGYDTYGFQINKDVKSQTVSYGPAEKFKLKLRITYCDEDDRRYEKEYYLVVPNELLTNYSEVKFNKWAKEEHKNAIRRSREEIVEKICKAYNGLPNSKIIKISRDIEKLLKEREEK